MGESMRNCLVLLSFMLVANAASAGDLLGYLTDENGHYTGPTVEENVVLMDTDKNGFADVTEVRAFLALKNGSDYQKEILDRWQLRSQGKSCTLPPDDKLFNKTN
jgi:purine nucleoside permease